MRQLQSTTHHSTSTAPLPDEGPELKVDKNNQNWYSDWELNDQIIARLKRVITQELEISHASSEDRTRIISELFAQLTQPVKAPSQLPDKAPALYKERPDKSQSAENFTNYYYSKYFGKGLTRADLKRLDKSLYGMLMKGGFPPSLAENIPPAQGKGGGGFHGKGGSKGGSKPVYSPEELAKRTREQAKERMRRYRQRQSQG